MKQIKGRSLFVTMGFLFGLSIMISCQIANADDDSGTGYGPDWPVCRNLRLDPSQRLQACERLLQSGKLSTRDLSRTYNNRGTAWSDIGNKKKALEDYEKAIDIDPTNGPPYFNRGMYEHETGDNAKAIEDVRKAIQLKPQVTEFNCNLGSIFEDIGKLEDALATYEEGLKITPEKDCLLTQHATVLDRLERYREAAADFSKMIELDPTNRFAWIRRAFDYLDLGANKAAIHDASAALQLNPADIGATGVRAKAYFLDKQYDKANADCERLLAVHPDDVSCADFEIRGLLLAGQFQDAAGKAGELLDVHDMPGARVAQAVAEYALGSYDQASQDMRGAADADPDDPYHALFKYLVDRRLGRDDKKRVIELADRNDIWPTPLARYIAGRISKDELFVAVDVPDPDLKKQRTSEANFYLGELAALDGHADEAARFYKAALEIGEIRIGERRHFVLYKGNNDFEISLARAALHGKTL